MNTFKLVIIGDGGVGKTTFVKRHLTGEFNCRYVATQGVETNALTFNTNYGVVKFNVWDCAGQEKFGGLRDGYFIQADCAIAMYDVTSRLTARNLATWMRDFRRVCEKAPIVVVGNKSDCESDTKRMEITPDYLISTKSTTNHEKPLLDLAKKLMGKDDLIFLPHPSITPPTAY